MGPVFLQRWNNKTQSAFSFLTVALYFQETIRSPNGYAMKIVMVSVTNIYLVVVVL